MPADSCPRVDPLIDFLREQSEIIVIYRIGIQGAGTFKVVLNSDAAAYGGTIRTWVMSPLKPLKLTESDHPFNSTFRHFRP